MTSLDAVWLFGFSSSCLKFGIVIVVFTSTWSEIVFNVYESCSTRFVESDVRIRSIHDFLSPRSNVKRAGGPGWMPFSIYQLLLSHIPINQFALSPTVVSSLTLSRCVSPNFGCRLPTLAFQSPHTVDLVCGGMCPKMSSMAVLTSSSLMPRGGKLVVGGMYTLPIHSVSPPWPYIPTPWAYSLPTYLRIFTPFLIMTAIPPLLSLSRLSSYTWYPGISSFTSDFGSHVSWTHSTSNVCVSRIVLILYRLIPWQLKLPTVSPSFCQRTFLANFAFRRRADPLVRFFTLPRPLYWP